MNRLADRVTAVAGARRLLHDNDLVRRLDEAARRRIESQFISEQMVSQMETLYRDLLTRRRTT